MKFLYHTFYDPFWGGDDFPILNLNRVILILSSIWICLPLFTSPHPSWPESAWVALFGIWLFLILVKLWGKPQPKRKNDE